MSKFKEYLESVSKIESKNGLKNKENYMSKFKEYLEASRQAKNNAIEKTMTNRASSGKCMFCGETATHKNEQDETTCEKCKPGKLGNWKPITEEASQKITLKCSKCGHFDELDPKEHNIPDDEIDEEDWDWVECPECGRQGTMERA